MQLYEGDSFIGYASIQHKIKIHISYIDCESTSNHNKILILQIWRLLIHLNQNLISQSFDQIIFIEMLHPKFKLITRSSTILIDPIHDHSSDIDEEEGSAINSCTKGKFIIERRPPSLLASVTLKKRRDEVILKREAVVVNSDKEDSPSNSEESDDESLVFVKKVTNQGCLKNKLRRQVMVSNKVKLERRDENTENTIECAICLSDLKDLEEKRIGRLACKHVFCYSCILESSKFSNKCPYCRTAYSSIHNGKRVINIPQARLNEDFDDPMDEPCYICGRNDDFQRLLECEYCEYAYCHTYCDARLNSDQPPAGNWYCLSCEQMLRNQLPLQESDDEQIYEDQS